MNQYSKRIVLAGNSLLCALCIALGAQWAVAAPAPIKAAAPKAAAPKAAKAATPRTKPTPRAKVAAKPAASPTDKAKQLAKGFQQVDLNKRKLSPNWDRPYMLAAYGIVVVALLLYLLSLARRMTHTDGQLAQIERRLTNLPSNDNPSS